MPELPDVEYFRQYAEATVLHRRIERTSIADQRLLDETTTELLARRLKGHEFVTAARHGKHLFLELDSGDSLMLHFGMTGFLVFEESDEQPEYAQLILQFADESRLHYVNKRRLGSIALIEDIDEYVAEHSLGPDADALAFSELQDVISGGRGSIKNTLMNQSRIAGLGNIYTDELLFQARIDPRREVSSLSHDDLRALHDAMQSVIERAVDAHAVPSQMPNHFLLPDRQEGAPCPSCGGEVSTITLSGRTTAFCPRCQQ